MVNSALIKNVEEKVRKDLKELEEAEIIFPDREFLPCVHYPPITRYPSITEEALFNGYQNPSDGLFDIYAHIPFCIRQCVFCHYPVQIGASLPEKDKYLNALEKEMDIYINRLDLKKIKARSILIGGGTPTYLTTSQFNRFLRFFTSRLNLTSRPQFSFDVDSSTLLGRDGMERLKIMKFYGVNRLTIGIQSLDDDVLEKMNRPHNVAEAIEAIRRSQEAGFKLNIEFIYGYPKQTAEDWIKTLEKAVSLAPDEIQIYRLKIIPYGDRMGLITKKFVKDTSDFCDIVKTLTMKELANEILTQNGYPENLRRVFSRSPEDFSHYADNQCCGLYDQIGFGLTAFSSLRDRFGLNTQDFKEYYSLINQGKLPLNRGLVRNKDDQLRWAFVLPLKNRKVHKKYYQKITGVSPNEVFADKIEKLKKLDLLYEDDKVLMLTKRGILFADEICQLFYHPKYLNFDVPQNV